MLRTGLLASTLGLLLCDTLVAQRVRPPEPEGPPKSSAADDIPAAVTHYRGRRIAPTMHYKGAEWLVRDEREREERATVMLKALKIEPGQTVCDLGCGNGFHTLPLAKMVGKTGRVVAVDVQREMLLLLQERAKEQDLANIDLVHSLPHDPKLKPASLDLVLLVDVYHEFSHPEPMLIALRRALRPRGRIALVEFRAEDPKVPIKPEHKMSKEQILKEFEPNGFKLVAEYNELPWQHLMFFEVAGEGRGGKVGRKE